MYLYEDQFSLKHDFPKVDKPIKTLVIASTGRSGSHMLGHALHETKQFGFPLEYLNPANLKEWKSRLHLSETNLTIEEIKNKRTSPNGVFSIKVHYPQIKQLGNFEKFLDIFQDSYYVLLSRKDVLRQAISMSIAKQTGVWIAGQKPVNNNPEYDFIDIDRQLRQVILQTSSWRYALAANGCNYIELDFNTVRWNLAESILKIAKFMDVEIKESDIPKEQLTKKQSNSVNKIWESRFISDFEKNDELLSHSEKKKLNKEFKEKFFDYFKRRIFY